LNVILGITRVDFLVHHESKGQEQPLNCPALVAISQVSEDAAELRGSLRFMACLFKEHLLPIHFVHALVLELLARAEASGGQRPLHSQPMVALGLVSMLQCCADL
jgi:hypothetical protein